MSDNKRLIRKIIYDCGKIMWMAVFFYIFQSVLNEYISIYTASVLGKLADAVLKLDTTFGVQQFWKIIGCVSLSVILLPVLETVAEMMMFRKSLAHDQMLLQRFFNKTYTAYSKMGAGEIQFHLDDDACDFRILWVQLVTKAVTIPVAMAYLLYYTLPVSILYTVIVFVVSLFQLAAPVAAHKLRKKYDQQTREYYAKIRMHETDMTTKPHMIRILGLKKIWIQKFDRLFQNYYQDVFVKHIHYLVMADIIQKFVNTFCFFSILISGAVMASQNRIVPGTIVAMMGYFSVFHSIISDIGFMIRNVPILMNLANRLKEIYEGEERQGGMTLEEVRSITVENLSFLYEYNYSKKLDLSENVVVFENVSFNVNIGTKMALCGRNGSGKSTLLKVLCGLLEKYNGNIYINGQTLSDIGLESWRKQISYIDQEPFLFSGSVFENIWIGNLDASQAFVEQIMKELRIAHLSDYVIGADLAGLSGGERQKISIARALLKDPPILLMDEPNNYLDEETLLWLQNFIIKVPKTVIFILHDSELMKKMEYKILLE